MNKIFDASFFGSTDFDELDSTDFDELSRIELIEVSRIELTEVILHPFAFSSVVPGRRRAAGELVTGFELVVPGDFELRIECCGAAAGPLG